MAQRDVLYVLSLSNGDELWLEEVLSPGVSLGSSKSQLDSCSTTDTHTLEVGDPIYSNRRGKG